MKVMAIGTLKPLSQEQRQRYLPKEVPATLQLYLDGKMEQFWLRDKEEGVIFLMSVDSVDEAARLLNCLSGIIWHHAAYTRHLLMRYPRNQQLNLFETCSAIRSFVSPNT